MICLIPARGGSKRFPGKNIANLFGQPVINHTIDICWGSGLFDDVIVSTDSPDVARMIDCDFWMRPDFISGDIPEVEVLKHHMDQEGLDEICRVYPFACLLTSERLADGWSYWETCEYDSVMERQKFSYNPQRAITEEGRYFLSEFSELASEGLIPLYHDAGTFMYTSRSALDLPLRDRKIKWIDIPETEAQDVDTLEDFEILKLKMLRRML